MSQSNSYSSMTPKNGTAYINGRIYTVNEAAPWAEAFIVGPDGTFGVVGTDKEVKAKALEDGLAVYDLRGKFIMPGIHDAHVHMLLAGVGMTSQALLPTQGLNSTNVAESLDHGSCMCKYAHVNQDWLVAWAYMVDDFHRDALDKEYPDTPVVIHGGAGHSMFLNTEALRRAGYDVDSEPDGQATMYVRDEAGRLTGHVAEMGMSKAARSIPQPSLGHVKRALRHAQHQLHRAGVTSCQEASANSIMLHALKELDAEKDLKLNMYTHIVYAPDWVAEESVESLHKLIDDAAGFRSDHVDTRFVKIILDGVPLPPYYTQAGFNKDDGTVDESKLFILNVKEAVAEYDARGFTMKIHCTGTGATKLALDAFDAARKTNPRGPRHEIAHSSGVRDEDFGRYKTLNVTAEMSPAFFFVHPVTAASGGLMDWNFPRMIEADAHVTIGSDWCAPNVPDLLPILGNIVESVGGGDRTLGAARICRMLTLAGAEAVGKQNEFGSVEPGKKANFIALNNDLSKAEFEGVKVLTTWFEGEIVYEEN
ncbi:uncharacterized protein PV06_01423 [Exophiala oligosperma]|uniref:Amidohydrolase 3 domain-containing protein n=1 Tax=Exophiala oligosperma TaxID=215243 RepID=A0A0D2CG27_9EURO|nr:uncharacterized protein PV06_01423 [Exophiala oligosperma]KIW48862.1 hypothetical protein PV06_01423 [Exophiala oligosperma]